MDFTKDEGRSELGVLAAGGVGGAAVLDWRAAAPDARIGQSGNAATTASPHDWAARSPASAPFLGERPGARAGDAAGDPNEWCWPARLRHPVRNRLQAGR